jgi:pyridoxal phosphate enzyme (YggS family)
VTYAHPDDAIAARLAAVRARIVRACERAGRAPEDVRLLAVSKKHDVDAIRACYAMGQREFGENYVQELVAKADALADLPDLRLHLIGHLQRNKVKDVVRVGAAVDTVDSLRLAESLAERANALGKRARVLVQVNVGDEAQKSGVPDSELAALIERIRELPALSLGGLLAIPPVVSDPEQSRPYFRRVRALATEYGLSEVSMGMSDDLEIAIQEGATVVRVGTAIFGSRA